MPNVHFTMNIDQEDYVQDGQEGPAALSCTTPTILISAQLSLGRAANRTRDLHQMGVIP